jgi:hypothetical protein
VDSGSAHRYVNLDQIENKIEKNVKMLLVVKKKKFPANVKKSVDNNSIVL